MGCGCHCLFDLAYKGLEERIKGSQTESQLFAGLLVAVALVQQNGS
jgi:hypothetical protein